MSYAKSLYFPKEAPSSNIVHNKLKIKYWASKFKKWHFINKNNLHIYIYIFSLVVSSSFSFLFSYSISPLFLHHPFPLFLVLLMVPCFYFFFIFWAIFSFDLMILAMANDSLCIFKHSVISFCSLSFYPKKVDRHKHCFSSWDLVHFPDVFMCA